MARRSVVPGQIEGFLAGCPFCTARRKTSPDIGVRFRIISGPRAGETGVVIQKPERYSLRPTEIVAHMDNHLAGHDRRLLLDHELIQELPASPTPEWAPFLSFQDAAIVDDAIADFCTASYLASQWSTNWPVFFEIIRRIWEHRLPITAAELTDLLSAHGVRKSWQKGLSDFFEKGLELLVYVNGRKPIRNKRTKTRLGE
jgi:hypothetical protein